MPALFSMKDCLKITTAMTTQLSVEAEVINDPKYDLIFSVEEVNRRVTAGVPFRDAYHAVSTSIKQGNLHINRKIDHTHIGSIGNLGNDLIKESFKKAYAFFE